MVAPLTQKVFEKTALTIVQQPSAFGSIDVHTQTPCRMEGIVSRNIADYPVSDFKKNVFKYVRKDHVKTDEHWIRNWKRAPLKWERKT